MPVQDPKVMLSGEETGGNPEKEICHLFSLQQTHPEKYLGISFSETKAQFILDLTQAFQVYHFLSQKRIGGGDKQWS